MKTSKVLRVAKRYVGTTYTESYKSGMERFICCAIDSAAVQNKRITQQDIERVCAIVQERLAPHISLESWLEAYGVVLKKQDLDRVQQHRHAWLDMMIKEFEAKGD